MKKILFIAFALFSVTACGKVDDEYIEREVSVVPDGGGDSDPIDVSVWNGAATAATDNMLATFWKNHSGNWYFDYGDGNNNHYWPQAHAMDVAIDAYIRTGEQKYLDMYPLWFEGVRKGGNWNSTGTNGNWRNPYIDDMEWIVMTQIRMYETSDNADYLTRARQIYDDWIMPSEWNARGGVNWYVGDRNSLSQNACSNGPAAIIAAKLYNITQENKYKEQAIQIIEWMNVALLNASGEIADNINKDGGKNGGGLTYNQGTYLGACRLLYHITGEQAYMDYAIKAAEFTMTNMVTGSGSTVTGVLRNEGTGDNELFKGIFVRYFVDLANDTAVPTDKRQKYHEFMEKNVVALWTYGVSDINAPYFSPDWTQKPTGTNMLNRNVSACTLLEGINALKPIQ